MKLPSYQLIIGILLITICNVALCDNGDGGDEASIVPPGQMKSPLWSRNCLYDVHSATCNGVRDDLISTLCTITCNITGKLKNQQDIPCPAGSFPDRDPTTECPKKDPTQPLKFHSSANSDAECTQKAQDMQLTLSPLNLIDGSQTIVTIEKGFCHIKPQDASGNSDDVPVDSLTQSGQEPAGPASSGFGSAIDGPTAF